MQVLCIRTCYDSGGFAPYHEGDFHKINDETRARWEELEFLQYFADPETGKPLQVLPEKPDPLIISDPLANVKAVGEKILVDVEKRAAEILAAAEIRATEIVNEAIEASKSSEKDGAPEPEEVVLESEGKDPKKGR